MLSSVLLSVVALSCGCLAADAWEYNDSLVRNKFYPIAAASWSWEGDTGCLSIALPDVENYKRYVVNVGKTACYAVVGTSEAARTIAISFRGTDGTEQFWKEFVGSLLPTEAFANSSAHVNVYFKSAFNALWEEILPDVQQLLTAKQGYEVWITGHSMGGSLASLAALWLSSSNAAENDKIKCVTFAQPRTGQKDFAQLVQQQVPNHYRVISKADPVPHLPPTETGYYHFDRTIAYDGDMTPTEWKQACDDSESLLQQVLDGCFGAVVQWEWLRAHHYYFGKHISDWGNAGCK